MEDKGATTWMPEALSTMAPEIDSLFYFVFWVSVIIFVAVMGAMMYFVIKYKRTHPNERTEHVEESRLLETTWVVVPTILVMIVFTWGFQSFIKMSVSPPDAYEIIVRGQKWSWNFEYPNGTLTTNELHVPVDRPVKLKMSSIDVLHSFFIPVFRVKHDVLPNRYTSVWFEATETGEYDLFCTEYCGTQHSGMIGKVFIKEQSDFDTWLDENAMGDMESMPLPELGEVLYKQRACFSCHSLDGTRVVGPTFQGLYGSNRVFEDGSSGVADDNYLRESILNPAARIVQGYPNGMPAMYTDLSERELSGLIAYIQAQQ